MYARGHWSEDAVRALLQQPATVQLEQVSHSQYTCTNNRVLAILLLSLAGESAVRDRICFPAVGSLLLVLSSRKI